MSREAQQAPPPGRGGRYANTPTLRRPLAPAPAPRPPLARYFASARLMTMRWISLVPSKMV